jgi:tetratricopeptide (TPR) repeat protein
VKTKPGKPSSKAGLAASKPEKKYANNPAPIRHRRVRFIHDKQMMAHMKTIKPGAGAQLVSATKTYSSGRQPVSWEQTAFWYEYQGDYRSAAAAYEQAAPERPTDSVMFNAGLASECAGDVAQAIEYYARVLKHERQQESQSKQDSQPKKGTRKWNENQDSA